MLGLSCKRQGKHCHYHHYHCDHDLYDLLFIYLNGPYYQPSSSTPSRSECDIWVSKLFHFFDGISISFEKFWYKKSVVWVSKKFGMGKSIGIDFKKKLVSVSEKFGNGKKFRIWFRSDFWFRHTLIPIYPPKKLGCLGPPRRGQNPDFF